MLFLVGVDPGSTEWDALPFCDEPYMEIEATRELAEYLLFGAAFQAWSGGGECFVNVPDELVEA